VNAATALLIVALAQAGAQPVPLRVVAQGQQSEIREPRQIVVTSREAWAALWQQHGAQLPVPAVDFTHESIVAVFLGTRPSGGFAVDILAVRTGSAPVVEYRERRPGPDMMTTQALTFPFSIVAVPVLAGTPRFAQVP
jgi:hypothetical protein